MHEVCFECSREMCVCVCVNLSSHEHMNEQTSEFRLPVDENKSFVCLLAHRALNPARTGPSLRLIVYNIPKEKK